MENNPIGVALPGGSCYFPDMEDVKYRQSASNPVANNIQMTDGRLAILHTSEPNLSVPERGTTGPISIGKVMEPIRRIIAHPDRNHLMAEFFKRHW